MSRWSVVGRRIVPLVVWLMVGLSGCGRFTPLDLSMLSVQPVDLPPGMSAGNFRAATDLTLPWATDVAAVQHAVQMIEGAPQVTGEVHVWRFKSPVEAQAAFADGLWTYFGAATDEADIAIGEQRGYKLLDGTVLDHGGVRLSRTLVFQRCAVVVAVTHSMFAAQMGEHAALSQGFTTHASRLDTRLTPLVCDP